MPANFQSHLDRGAAAVNAVHGENIKIQPMVNNQHSGSAVDDTRIVTNTVDVLRIETDGIGDFSSGRQRQNISIGTGQIVLYLARAGLPDGAVFKEGDRVFALDRDGAPQFRIDRVNNRGRARMVLFLSAIGASNA